jgi:tRNA(adenine34) deaminase
MKQALILAKLAADHNEVPVGALIVGSEGQIVAEAYNKKESKKSALAHAELLAIEQACQKLGTWRLHGCTLYVTLEPCPMCSGAIWASQIDGVVFGAYDTKTGFTDSLYKLGEDQRLNHRYQSTGGILEDECREILQDFFKKLRSERKS